MIKLRKRFREFWAMLRMWYQLNNTFLIWFEIFLGGDFLNFSCEGQKGAKRMLETCTLWNTSTLFLFPWVFLRLYDSYIWVEFMCYILYVATSLITWSTCLILSFPIVGPMVHNWILKNFGSISSKEILYKKDDMNKKIGKKKRMSM